MAKETGFFETLYTTRAIRQARPGTWRTIAQGAGGSGAGAQRGQSSAVAFHGHS